MAIFALRTTSNREDQVFDFIMSNIERKGLKVYSVIRAHGLRGYVFVEAEDREAAEDSYQKVPYARGLLPKPIDYSEIEHMLEQVKVQVNILKGDIVEVISGPFKREEAKVSRIDHTKDEVVVELLEAAVPIPITVKMDSVKVIRRDESAETQEAMSAEKTPEEHVPIKSVDDVMKEDAEKAEQEQKEEEKTAEAKKKKKKPADDDVALNLDDDDFKLEI